MSSQTQSRWQAMRTDDSRAVEEKLRQAFPQTDAYRYNSASIRVRVIDERFEGKSEEERDAMVEPLLAQLDDPIQADIMNLLTLTPEEAEAKEFSKFSLLNLEFEDPSPSEL